MCVRERGSDGEKLHLSIITRGIAFVKPRAAAFFLCRAKQFFLDVNATTARRIHKLKLKRLSNLKRSTVRASHTIELIFETSTRPRQDCVRVSPRFCRMLCSAKGLKAIFHGIYGQLRGENGLAAFARPYESLQSSSSPSFSSLACLTYPNQVEFIDSSESPDISAIQADEKSEYIAQDTAFRGYEGEVGLLDGVPHLEALCL